MDIAGSMTLSILVDDIGAALIPRCRGKPTSSLNCCATLRRELVALWEPCASLVLSRDSPVCWQPLPKAVSAEGPMGGARIESDLGDSETFLLNVRDR
jgi:hypothetical protein